MTLADLTTATQLDLNITVVVFNNHALQMESDKIQAAGVKELGTQLTNPDFVKVAEACGLKGYHIKGDSGMEEILVEALKYQGPALVDIDKEQAFFPETE